MMKILLISILLFTTTMSFAEIKLSEIQGSWSILCTQATIDSQKGFLIETYTFKDSSFTRTRDWYSDSVCNKKTSSEIEKGKILISNNTSSNSFNPPKTYKASFRTSNGTDHGLIWLDEAHAKIRLSRGIGKNKSTLLGIFDYIKKS